MHLVILLVASVPGAFAWIMLLVGGGMWVERHLGFPWCGPLFLSWFAATVWLILTLPRMAIESDLEDIRREVESPPDRRLALSGAERALLERAEQERVARMTPRWTEWSRQ